MRHLQSLVSFALILGFPVVLATALPAFAARHAAAAEPGPAAQQGKALFLAQKCDLCHGLASLGIEARASSQTMRGPDLDTVGQRHDADRIAAFVSQRVEFDGAVHKKGWKGSDEELQALAAWLAGPRN
ncbi:MAG TPA: cytochrome c [Thermoanaerobaculia bacterium]|nr:cytochrome c [Thermoanaerobaculia bacterium]